MNADVMLTKWRDRILPLERTRRESTESIEHIYTEMRAAKRSKVEIAGMKLRVKREWKDAQKEAAKEALRAGAEEVADSLALSGAPLFAAAS